MKQTFLNSLVSFFFFALLASCHTHDSKLEGKKRILVLYQIESNTVQETMFKDEVKKVFGDTSRYELTMRESDLRPFQRAPLREYFHNAVPSVNRQLNAFDGQPDLVIVHSEDLAHSAAMCDHPKLTRCPVVCMGVVNPSYNDSLVMRRDNFVVFQQTVDLRENIDFIQKINPQPWLVIPLDSTYIDDYLRQEIIDQLGSDTVHYATNLHYETVARYVSPPGRDYSRISLIPISLEYPLENQPIADSIKTLRGVLHVKSAFCNYLRIKDDCYSDQALQFNLGLFFSMTPNQFNKPINSALNACVGGYFTPWFEQFRQMKPTIDLLLSGANPKSVGHHSFVEDYWIDWRLGKQFLPFAEDFPRGTRFVNMPWYESSRAAKKLKDFWIPWTVALFVFLLIAIPLCITIYKIRQQQKLVEQGNRSNEEEMRIESLMLALNVVSWELSADKLITFPEKARPVLGLKQNSIPLDNILQLLSESDRQALLKAIDEVPESGLSQLEVLVSLADGQQHSVVIFINHNHDNSQHFICNGLAFNNDKEHELKQEREQALKRSEEANVKEAFLASMSHEIRTPLNAIVGFSDILVSQHSLLTKDERQQYGKYVKDSNEQLLRLLDDILHYSSDNKRDHHLKLSTKDVESMIDEIYNIHTVIVPQHLQLIYLRGPKAKMLVNRVSLLQIMSNIINNAIKFTDKGSITIGWNLESDVDGKWVVLFVEDTGIGIAPDKIANIFTKYYKTSSTSSGAGIGLSLCKHLVEKMGGTISVTSQVCKGSRFEVKVRSVD